MLSEIERIEILMMFGWGDRRRHLDEVCELFNNTHPERQAITKSTVSKIVKKFHEHGTVKDLPRTGRPKLDDNIKLDVLLSYNENPHLSTHQVALDLNVCQSSVKKILHKEKYHPYKIRLIHELNEDDYDRRLQFCENMQERCNMDPLFCANVLFSDEATFFLNGTVNRQNCRYWSKENPHWAQVAHTQHPEKVNVWAGIFQDQIVGPYFFDENLTGQMYLDFLQVELIPALAQRYPGDEPDTPALTMWFQQDGAPPHYALAVRQYLNEIFPNRWIGRRGPIEWPARSPDLTPLDYFLWGYLKSKVYFNRPPNIEALKNRIRDEIRQIPPFFIRNVQEEFMDRLGYCQEVNGQQFQHLLR